MKLFFFVLALSMSHIVFSQTGTDGGWSPIRLPRLNVDSNLREILNFGVQDVIAKATEAGKLPNANYYIEDVLSIQSQVVAGTNYNFSVVLADDEGNQFTSNFTVSVDLNEAKTVRPDYLIVQVQGEGSPLGNWKPIDVSRLDTDLELNNILDRFSFEVVARAVDNNQLSSIDYRPSKVYSIKEQSVSGTNYRFNIELESYDGGHAHVIFVVYDPWTNPGEPRRLTSILFLDIQEAESQPN